MENRYLEVMERKQTITSLELLEQINLFRKQEGNKTELRHDNLMAVIRDEFEEEISLLKIQESTYKNDRGREYPMFILTLSQSKQVLMRESKFVRKAVINYIEVLESKLNQPMTIEEMIISQAKSVFELKNKFEVLEDKVNNQMTIDSGKQTSLQFKIKTRAYDRLESIGVRKEYVKIAIRFIFSALHRELKKKFGVPSYKDVKIKDYEDVTSFVVNWREDQSVRDKINEL